MNKLLIILPILFLFFSCDSWIDVKPENQVTYTNYFETEKDVEGAALQMLAAECAYIGCEGDYLKWLGILADEWSDTYNGPRLGRVSDLASGGVIRVGKIHTISFFWQTRYWRMLPGPICRKTD